MNGQALSRNRHAPPGAIPRDPDRATAAVVGISEDHPRMDGAPHAHRRAQLVYAVEGAITVEAERARWVLPPLRAAWIPGGVTHRVQSAGPFKLRTLYFDLRRVRGLPPSWTVFSVTPLAREVILALASAPWSWKGPGRESRLCAVLLDELASLEALSLSLPRAKDPRVARVCEGLLDDPSDARELSAWGRAAGASERNLARLFVADTGMTFGQWRQQRRLLAAVERLAAGQSVLSVAIELGYDSPSAFGAMFKRALGVTPGDFFRPGPLSEGAKAARGHLPLPTDGVSARARPAPE
jgi:AraC-like DNA-binding protein